MTDTGQTAAVRKQIADVKQRLAECEFRGGLVWPQAQDLFENGGRSAGLAQRQEDDTEVVTGVRETWIGLEGL